MVHNEDGTPIRSTLSPREFEEYCLKMIRDDLLETFKHKGKEHMHDPPEEEQEMKEEQSPSSSLGETLLDLSLNALSKDTSTEPGPLQASMLLVDSELAAAAITATAATATATVTAATTAAANPATIRAPSGSTSLADAPAHLLNFQDTERQFILMQNEINQLTAWRAEMQQWVILVEQWVGRVNSHIEESQN
jgi:hypothetical protein